jgi:hypothetical protein
MSLPPCGLYRTTSAIGGVPEGRLVYFHNHGNPGAGVYLPERWEGNRARFSANGHTLPNEASAASLAPLAPEGFYCVTEAFHCCEKQCRLFEASLFVQLGYDGAATPILFVPEVAGAAVALPERGVRVDPECLAKMVPLMVAAKPRQPEAHELVLH